jgi:hypothetical protein
MLFIRNGSVNILFPDIAPIDDDILCVSYLDHNLKRAFTDAYGQKQILNIHNFTPLDPICIHIERSEGSKLIWHLVKKFQAWPPTFQWQFYFLNFIAFFATNPHRTCGYCFQKMNICHVYSEKLGQME